MVNGSLCPHVGEELFDGFRAGDLLAQLVKEDLAVDRALDRAEGARERTLMQKFGEILITQ